VKWSRECPPPPTPFPWNFISFWMFSCWTSQQTKVGLNEVGGAPQRTSGYHQLPLPDDVVLWHIKIILDSLIMYAPLYPCASVPNNNPRANTSFLPLYVYVYIPPFFCVWVWTQRNERIYAQNATRKCPEQPFSNRKKKSLSEAECWILWIFTTLGWVA